MPNTARLYLITMTLFLTEVWFGVPIHFLKLSPKLQFYPCNLGKTKSNAQHKLLPVILTVRASGYYFNNYYFGLNMTMQSLLAIKFEHC